MTTFFTADHHFGHANIIKSCGRPFSSVEEMDEELIAKWNEVVDPDDRVFHLGDFALTKKAHQIKELVSRLNGFITLITGNHDKKSKSCYKSYGFSEAYDVLEIEMEGQKIFLSHYAHRTWPKAHYGSWHLFGHSHGNMPPLGKSFDVGVDSIFTGYSPVSFEEVKKIMINDPIDYWQCLAGK